ncbi:putative inorganic phosphate cotransporter, partial [Armadillidium nasatum]
MIFLALSCDYALRVNLSVAIVAMVNDTSSSTTDNTSTSDQCPYPDDQDTDDHYGGSGVFYPAINNIIPKWYPKKERSKFSAFFFSGMQFGIVISMTLSGYLCSTDFLGGWPSAFYVLGFLTVIWGVLWFILIKDNPQDHPRISKEELRYITDGCPILKNGLYTALPYIGGWIFSNLFGYFSDILLKKNILALVQVRRWAMVAALYGPMVCLIGMCFVDCNSAAAVAILFLGGTLNGAMFCGYMCSHADISPRFSASLMGITNTIATIPGFVSPAITGAITNNNNTIEAWRIAFKEFSETIIENSFEG